MDSDSTVIVLETLIRGSSLRELKQRFKIIATMTEKHLRNETETLYENGNIVCCLPPRSLANQQNDNVQ